MRRCAAGRIDCSANRGTRFDSEDAVPHCRQRAEMDSCDFKGCALSGNKRCPSGRLCRKRESGREPDRTASAISDGAPSTVCRRAVRVEERVARSTAPASKGLVHYKLSIYDATVIIADGTGRSCREGCCMTMKTRNITVRDGKAVRIVQQFVP